MEEKNEKLAKKYSIDSQNLILSVIAKGRKKSGSILKQFGTKLQVTKNSNHILKIIFQNI